MLIDKEKLELIQIVLRNEDAVSFWEKGVVDKKKGFWYIKTNSISEFGPETKENEESPTCDIRHITTFLEWTNNKDLIAETEIYSKRESGYDTEQFFNWDHLARYIGISELVVVSTKIPKNVAKKLKYYVAQQSDISTVLRELIYDYVKNKIIDNAEQTMFNE